MAITERLPGTEPNLSKTDALRTDPSAGLSTEVGLTELDILAGIPELNDPFLQDEPNSPLHSPDISPAISDPTRLFKGWVNALVERAEGGDEAILGIVGKPGTPDYEWNIGAVAREQSAKGTQIPRPGEPLIK